MNRIGFLGVSAGLIIAAATTAIVLAIPHSQAAPATPGVLSSAQLRAIAQAWSVTTGDQTPTQIQHVRTTSRQAAVKADSGDLVPGTHPSYVIVVRGHFTAAGLPHPRGEPVPAGTVLTLVVDATSGHVTDWGLVNRVPNIAKLGAVHTDLP